VDSAWSPCPAHSLWLYLGLSSCAHVRFGGTNAPAISPREARARESTASRVISPLPEPTCHTRKASSRSARPALRSSGVRLLGALCRVRLGLPFGALARVVLDELEHVLHQLKGGIVRRHVRVERERDVRLVVPQLPLLDRLGKTALSSADGSSTMCRTMPCCIMR